MWSLVVDIIAVHSVRCRWVSIYAVHPLLQTWLCSTTHTAGRDPKRYPTISTFCRQRTAPSSRISTLWRWAEGGDGLRTRPSAHDCSEWLHANDVNFRRIAQYCCERLATKQKMRTSVKCLATECCCKWFGVHKRPQKQIRKHPMLAIVLMRSRWHRKPQLELLQIA